MTISTEQFISVNTGISANDGTGDSLRAAFIKVNDNFNYISDIGFDAGNINCQGSIEVAGNLTITNTYVPATADAAGTPGQIAWSTTHVYVCVGVNTWKRANLAAW